MKGKLTFALVLVFSGIASSYTVPVCVQVCPTDAVAGDEITLTAYDEEGEKVDLTEWTGGVETNFGCDAGGFLDPDGEMLVDGAFVFTITQDMLDCDQWDFFTFIPYEADVWLPIAMPDFEEGAIFDSVADAVAAGGTCEGLSCGPGPIPNPILINPNVMLVYEEGETEGDFSVSLRNEPPAGDTITITVDPNNGGPSEDITLIGGSGPNGSITLTFNAGNWDVGQTVVFKAIDDDITELPQLSEEHTIHLVSSYPGHPTDANFVGEKNVTVTVVDNDLPEGETLYNGIVLPYTWPPQYPSILYEPMPVPYLDNPPAVIPIDVGRQLFVDDFLIETTDMARTYYQADYYPQNPVLEADKPWEDVGGGPFAAPFSGGAWYDPDDELFKIFYNPSFSEATALAISTDGKAWTKPDFGVVLNVIDSLVLRPLNPIANDVLTMTAYDTNGDKVDLGNWDLVEFCFPGGGGCIVTGGGGLSIVSGEAVWQVTQAQLNSGTIDCLFHENSHDPESEYYSWSFPFDTIDRGQSGNMVLRPIAFDSTTVWLDHNAPASERFKYFATEFAGPGGLVYRVSPNGINWSLGQGQADVWGDRTTVFYNPFRDVWVCSQRTEDSSGRAARSYVEGISAADLMSKITYNELTIVEGESVHWVGADYLDPHHTDPLWDFYDPALYTLDAAPYESIMLGQFSIWQGPSNEVCGVFGLQKRNDILLGFSRDGFHWDRPDRNRFIACTWDDQSWRYGNVQSVAGGPLVVGDELYFYFSGRAKPGPGQEWDMDGATGLAILRRDGFASMDASGSTKTLTTRPVSFQGKYLFVNVDCPSGELKVEVLNEASEVISPFTLANCDAISSDTTCKQVTWGSNYALSVLVGKPVRFRFTLDDGSLYAFWVSPNILGASYGYVGAGGPGFTGPRDTVGIGQQECGRANLDDISEINTADLAIIAAYWLSDCTAPDWCGGADLNPVITDRGRVNMADFAILAQDWLKIGCGLEVEVDMDESWMYQNLPGQTACRMTATASIIDDPLSNSSYTYEWEFILPDDATVAPTITAGGGPADPWCTFAAPSCNEPDGISDSGQPFTVRVTVTGNNFGNTAEASAQFGIALLGDVNNDTQVNDIDHTIINTFWRTGAAEPFSFKDCDINCDGAVNVADRSIANAVWRGVLGQNSISNPCPFR